VQASLDGLTRLARLGGLPGETVAIVAVLIRRKLSELEKTIQARRNSGLPASAWR